MSYTELYVSSDPNITYRIEGKNPSVRIIGVPFDYTSCFRPGSRFAPNAIRTAYQNVEIYSNRLDMDMESRTIEDLGNLRHTANIDRMLESVERVTSEQSAQGIPLAILGGEHSITFGSFGSFLSGKKRKKVGLVIFDAHLDLREEFSDLDLSHATFLMQLIKRKNLNPENILHIGTRAASKAEWLFAAKSGLNLIPAHEAHDLKIAKRKVIKFVRRFDQIYISYDLDGMDPAYAPGVGTPEPFGLTSEEVLSYLYMMKGSKIPVFDIVELAVPYDNGITAAVAAKLLNETACVASLASTKVAD